ncbi:hypothetical protein [Aurantimonas marianensis]|uniref:Uncharacterized protein n=1 Tax=Aurantimonas marianensis TaxID=2920428 RepID=A0A9X2HBB6_9HYPH|nr:hypothetical protein [Aurantimonas marianensis]MCP3056583.1 hypothetical protein [Aurantimonas marianensis]
MMPAATAPPKPVPEERSRSALSEAPGPGAADADDRAAAAEAGVGVGLVGVDEGRLAAVDPDLTAAVVAAAGEGDGLASPGLAFKALALVMEDAGLAAAPDGAAGLPPVTTGGVPAGVAGTDPGPLSAAAGFVDDAATAPPVAAALALSLPDGVDAADGAGAGFTSPGLGGAEAEAPAGRPASAGEAAFAPSGVILAASFAAAPAAAGEAAPARSADARLAGCDAVPAGAPASAGFAALCASVLAFLSPSVTVFFSAFRSIVCPRVCFGFDRRGRLVIAFAPFLLARAHGIAGSARRTQSSVFVLHSCGPCKHRLVPTIKLG